MTNVTSIESDGNEPSQTPTTSPPQAPPLVPPQVSPPAAQSKTQLKSTPTPPSPKLTSKLNDYAKRQQEILSRMERIESMIQKSTTLKRRRAAFLLDARPSFRRTHLRLYTHHYCLENIFCLAKQPFIPGVGIGASGGGGVRRIHNPNVVLSSSVIGGSGVPPVGVLPLNSIQPRVSIPKPKKGTKYTLVIEGRLLVPDNSTDLNASTTVFGQASRDPKQNSDQSPNISTSNTNSNPSSTIQNPSESSLDNNNSTPTTNDNDKCIENTLRFTHLFDKVIISFQKVYDSENDPHSTPFNTTKKSSYSNGKDPNMAIVPSIKIKKRRTTQNSNSAAASAASAAEKRSLSSLYAASKNSGVSNISFSKQKSNPPPTVLIWTREPPPISTTTSTGDPEIVSSSSTIPSTISSSSSIGQVPSSHQFTPTGDAHAFHAIYFDPEEEDDTDTNIGQHQQQKQQQPQQQQQQQSNESTKIPFKIIAKVSLYRRWLSPPTHGPKDAHAQYKPSSELMKLLLPQFMYQDPSLDSQTKKNKDKEQTNSKMSNVSKSSIIEEKKIPRKKTKITISMKRSKKKKQSKATNDSDTGTNTQSDSKTISDPKLTGISSISSSSCSSSIQYSSFHIPQTITMNETISAVFLYIKENSLQDRNDLSIVNNDDALTQLFGCSRMLFSKVQELLIERKLLTLVTRMNVEPVTITYVMTKDGCAPLPKWMQRKEKGNGGNCGVVGVVGVVGSGRIGVPQSKSVLGGGGQQGNRLEAPSQVPLRSATGVTVCPTNDMPTKSSRPESSASKSEPKSNESTQPTKRKRGLDTEFGEEAFTLPKRNPESLVFNMNIDIPSDFHPKIIELLRRVKRRELEYTSSRTKALKILQSSIASNHQNSTSSNNQGQSAQFLTPNIHSIEKDEHFFKSKIEEVVSSTNMHTIGGNLRQYHVPVLMALAKSAPKGSEASQSAFLDARMGILLDRLDYHLRRANMCWDVVRACQQRSNDS